MSKALKLEKIDSSSLTEVFVFLERIFSQEQQIPKELIPLPQEQQHWWCIKKEGKIVGTVAAWKEAEDWHWGRLAVDPAQRGSGLGKALAIGSFQQLFDSGIDRIVIDARDITVNLIKSLGGKITGPTTKFYNDPITPMAIKRNEFLKKFVD